FPQSAYFDEHIPPVDLPSFHYHRGCNDLGVGPGHGCDESIRHATHTWGNAVSNTGDNLFAWLLLVGGGPMVFVAAAASFGARDERSRSAAFLAHILLVVGAYALYWYAGTCYGARFYHAALPFLLILAAMGLARLRRARSLAPVLAVWMAWSAFAFVKSWGELTRDYWGTDGRFKALEQRWTGPPALILIAVAPETAKSRTLYWTTRLIREAEWNDTQRLGEAMALNSPTADGAVLFAKFHPALADALQARFPGRVPWIYVTHEHAGRDVLLPYDRSMFSDAERASPPRDNFDGYRLSDEGRPLGDQSR
ncbi:MAG: hypothetical protein JOZ69_15470, partial [Myxococcales bacterium]|nr:hypothetical protein [Myxococcales bacterium]